MSDEGQGLPPDELPEAQLENLDVATSSDGFAYFRMSGGRFEGEGLPADAAAEIQRYAELVYEVARLKWLEAHPERSAVRGLKDAFDLRLVEIQPGSTRPVFKLNVRFEEELTDGDPEPFFVRARDVVKETIEAIGQDHSIPADFPRRAIPQLKRMGRSLADDEQIELASPRPRGQQRVPEAPAVLSPQTRDVIKLIDSALAPEPEWADATGVVSEFDGAKGTFRLDLEDGGSITCRLSPGERALAETVKTVLAADGVTAPDVKVGGFGDRDRRGTLTRLSDVSEVAVVRTPREKAMMHRLDEIGELPPDWWGRGTRAPGAAAMRNARGLVPLLARAAHQVAIGADGDGSIVLEWREGTLRRSVEIQADGRMYLFAYDTATRLHSDEEGAFDNERAIRFIETGALGA